MLKTIPYETETLINNGGIFKLICGAGNESVDEVYHLSFIYTIAGAKIIDVAAIPQIVTAAYNGIDDAFKFMKDAPEDYNFEFDKTRPYIMVSVGVTEDPHTRKAQILEDMCFFTRGCNKKCVDVCTQGAINLPYIDQTKCIGCGKCQKTCEHLAISYTFISKINTSNLIKCKHVGADLIELHASTSNTDHVISELELIKTIFKDNYISLCVSREHLNDIELINMIKQAHELIGEQLIVQADGLPMSGGENTFNSTLQAVATADIINKELGFEIPIFISGGTNAKSVNLVNMCNIKINGIAIGSYAREIIKEKPLKSTHAIKTACVLVRNVNEGLVYD
jgi:Fe-S-cluster-containing hydrogenase component 2